MAESEPLLVIGNKNYSSWSLRAWLTLRVFGVPFRELKLPLDTDEFEVRIGEFSPSRRVWDSMAINEYANERWLGGRGWPADIAVRAHARAICAEMHAGFTALRQQLPMNCRKRVDAHAIDTEAAQDIERVCTIWRDARMRHGAAGEFLFGDFCIADAMYAPIVLRFMSYGIALDGEARRYADTILALPAMQEWLAEAAGEPVSALHEQMKP
jgi:glutathione S-transferase